MAFNERMIKDADRKRICDLARKYGVSRLLLFGSAAQEGAVPRDIDLGVEGIDPKLFFRFLGDLICELSMPVDLVDLSRKSRFTDLVRREGVAIYG